MDMITAKQAHLGAVLLLDLIKQADTHHPGHDPLDAEDMGFQKGQDGALRVYIGVHKDGKRFEIKTPGLVVDRDHEDMQAAAGAMVLSEICKQTHGNCTDGRTGETVPALSEPMVHFAVAIVETYNGNDDPTVH